MSVKYWFRVWRAEQWERDSETIVGMHRVFDAPEVEVLTPIGSHGLMWSDKRVSQGWAFGYRRDSLTGACQSEMMLHHMRQRCRETLLRISTREAQ